MDDFDKALESVFAGKATILNRMRLACTFYNEDLTRKSNDVEGGILSLTLLPNLTIPRLAGHE
jgi:hypothetical protein